MHKKYIYIYIKLSNEILCNCEIFLFLKRTLRALKLIEINKKIKILTVAFMFLFNYQSLFSYLTNGFKLMDLHIMMSEAFSPRLYI